MVDEDCAVVPVPLTLTACGLPVPLLITLIDALRAPVLPGLNVTPIEQLPPTAMVVQVELAMANSDGLLLPTLDTETAAPPILVTDTLLAALMLPTVWLPKVSDEFIDSWPGDAPAEPVPLTPTVSAPPVRLTVMLALARPEAVGWKATAKLHVAPTATVTLEQVFDVSGKWVGSPLAALTEVADDVPALVMVTVIAALVAPTDVDPNATGAGAAWRLGDAAGQAGA